MFTSYFMRPLSRLTKQGRGGTVARNMTRAAWRVSLAAWLCAFFATATFSQSTSEQAVEGEALVKTWVQPEYPAELKAQKVQGEVSVSFIVDEAGKISDVRITKSSDPRFEPSVLAAIPQWTFDPAVSSGLKVASGVQVKWYFKLPYPKPGFLPPLESTPSSLPRKAAVAEFTPDPKYPEQLVARKLNGEVQLELEISNQGAVSDAKILFASSAEFIRAALDAVHGWKFKPATQGDLTLPDRKRSPLTFDYDDRLANDGKSPLQANGIELQVPEGMTVRAVCDTPPEMLAMLDPVFPQDLLAGNDAGEAEVLFTISQSGFPENVRLAKASHPSCGHALVAATEACMFKPAVLDGRAVEVHAVRKWHFTQPSAAAMPGESDEIRLLRTLKAGEAVSSAKGLDGKLKPLWRAMPVYPSALKAESASGRGEVEFIIDRTGRARAPKITSATHEEFGWAAATAISQWVFAPPTRGGEPVDVRVRIPLDFSPGK